MNAEYISVLVPVATFLGTIAVVVLGFLFNNSRVSDLRSDFSARFDALSGSFNTRFSDLKRRHTGEFRQARRESAPR